MFGWICKEMMILISIARLKHVFCQIFNGQNKIIIGFHQPLLPFSLTTPHPQMTPLISPRIHQKMRKGCRNDYLVWRSLLGKKLFKEKKILGGLTNLSKLVCIYHGFFVFGYDFVFVFVFVFVFRPNLKWFLKGHWTSMTFMFFRLNSIEDFRLDLYWNFQLILPMRFHFMRYFVNNIIFRVFHRLMYCVFIEVDFEKKKMTEIFQFLQK